ncbi:unnamed protein product [Rotaria magnacalcarata]|uniref:Uncharacterized protein n=1 Tax=Rotaria magnacalcarata TaxID=392030 RepID=A0A819EM44_9BILA|nr:unnamed protein product [Rotaria magnacalcarata]CAF3852974.1 unnamed protein product [Rotaria magnacalcarata]
MLLNVIIVWFIVILPLIFSQSRLYWTDIVSENELWQEHDCLYRHEFMSATASERVHEIVPYCFRSSNTRTMFSNTSIGHGNTITFDELRKQNVTSQQLYSWSGPIDIVERYHMYLDNSHDVSLSEQTFYNCTSPWFGVSCEFSFNMSMEFTDIVWTVFNAKPGEWKTQIAEISNYSCYIHISMCDRGPEPLCLDWREICDGKLDCANGGRDEEGCEVLETNECGSNEYRCHNGLCIPADNFHDMASNPDCLDGSDEPPKLDGCTWSPAFSCEELACRNALEFACGDGGCSERGYPTDYGVCSNGRDARFSLVITAKREMPALSEKCWQAMMCVTALAEIASVNCQCEEDMWDNIIQAECTSEFIFPSQPVLFHHVYFVFLNNQTITKNTIWLPNYICYDIQLCPFLPATKIINGSTCRYYSEFNLHNDYIYFNKLIVDLIKIFRTCSMKNDIPCHQYPNLFQCDTNSSKCISHHRRVDGVTDCAAGIDEQTQYSCSIEDEHRFRCSPSSSVCIAPITIQDKKWDCLAGEDERKPEARIVSFPTLCDRFQDQTFELINGKNESDETDCQDWQCNNIYNRCDGFYNCLNEVDEANCSYSLCPPFYHPCVSRITKKFICLPMNQVNDGTENCIGASDERQYCRDVYPSVEEKNFRFKCWNHTDCYSPGMVCDDEIDCPYEDDEQFCEPSIGISEAEGRCRSSMEKNRTLEENLVCNITDEFKKMVIYFSLRNSYVYPTLTSTFPINSAHVNLYDDQQHNIRMPSPIAIDLHRAWHCYRGILVYRNTFEEEQCLCPPSYYGDKCQYQNQRVSLIVQFQQENSRDQRAVFHVVIMLVDDSYQIHSYDHIVYVPTRDCNIKHNVYLLYQTRPKDTLRNYTIRIDVFNKSDLSYYTSWQLAIPFIFLPINRLSARVTIPAQHPQMRTNCPLVCNHGQCMTFGNTKNIFCRCDAGWSGDRCSIFHECDCGSDSLCVGSRRNRSICVCQTGKLGSRCLLQSTVCQLKDVCKHGGQCIPMDERISEHRFTCLCMKGFSGPTCEIINTQIVVSFKDVNIPQFILAHFIEIFTDAHPVRISFFSKVPFDSDRATLFIAKPYHMIFVEFAKDYYLAYVQETYIPSTTIKTNIIPAHRCASVDKIFNSTIVQWHSLRRIKLYHMPCQLRPELACFYDEKFICLCNLDRHANCFEFDHNMHYNCLGRNHCENGGQCFQDDPHCPTTSMCVCAECFYGARCQLSTQSFDLSLDAIIGYSIYPNVAFSHQPAVIKVTTALTMIMSTIGVINGILSAITFRVKIHRGVGCDIYLLTASIVSIFSMIGFTYKFFFLLSTQMAQITGLFFLRINCILIDFSLKILVNIGSWLNACVSVERAYTIWMGTHFDCRTSKRIAKWIILFSSMLVILTGIHEPIYRNLIYDDEEQRTWCIAIYPERLQVYISAMNTFHVLAPFILNFMSALVIIILSARKRSTVQKNRTYKQHLNNQLQQHKYLLISPCILVLLVLPRLIISYLIGCMKSTRDPWSFLFGYLVSFLPQILTFALFVAPSNMYKNELRAEFKRLQQNARSYILCNWN